MIILIYKGMKKAPNFERRNNILKDGKRISGYSCRKVLLLRPNAFSLGFSDQIKFVWIFEKGDIFECRTHKEFRLGHGFIRVR